MRLVPRAWDQKKHACKLEATVGTGPHAAAKGRKSCRGDHVRNRGQMAGAGPSSLPGLQSPRSHQIWPHWASGPPGLEPETAGWPPLPLCWACTGARAKKFTNNYSGTDPSWAARPVRHTRYPSSSSALCASQFPTNPCCVPTRPTSLPHAACLALEIRVRDTWQKRKPGGASHSVCECLHAHLASIRFQEVRGMCLSTALFSQQTQELNG